MDELVQFLRDRYDEEAAAAREAMGVVGPVLGAGQWRYAKSVGDEGGRYWSVTTTPPDDTVPTVELAGSGMSGGGVHEETVAAHIVRHDPARVLRDIKAKRLIVEEHAPVPALGAGLGCEICVATPSWGPEVVSGPCTTLRLLASVYSDHPDYREAWRP